MIEGKVILKPCYSHPNHDREEGYFKSFLILITIEGKVTLKSFSSHPNHDRSFEGEGHFNFFLILITIEGKVTLKYFFSHPIHDQGEGHFNQEECHVKFFNAFTLIPMIYHYRDQPHHDPPHHDHEEGMVESHP